MIEQVVAVLSTGNLVASVVAGVLAGMYLTTFHPTNPERGYGRLSLLFTWYFIFPTSIL